MEITLIAGMIAGFVCMVVGIIVGDGQISSFIDVTSIFVTIGGTLSATVASYSMGMIKRIPKLFGIAMRKSNIDLYKQIDSIIEMANVARKEGLLALENNLNNVDDNFLKNGIMLVLDGSDPELVRNVLDTEIHFMSERHNDGVKMFEMMASAAPAFGMAGTLIGLIIMLLSLEDQSTLGTSMAVALVTTFYGVLMANLIFMPVARQLRAKSALEQQQRDIIVEGVLSIQDGENPRVIKEKLLAFVSDKTLDDEKKPKGDEGGGEE